MVRKYPTKDRDSSFGGCSEAKLLRPEAFVRFSGNLKCVNFDWYGNIALLK
jgi:hypothetical protein